jgi:hypothetical protein
LEEYTIEDGVFGKRLVARAPWSRGMAREAGDVAELQLSLSRGWTGPDLEFLREVPHLLALDVINLRLENTFGIRFLTELRSLKLLTYVETVPDFSALTKLEYLHTDWKKGCDSIFSLPLRLLTLGGFNEKTCAKIGRLKTLEYLNLTSRTVQDISDLSTNQNLVFLQLTYMRYLKSLAPIGTLNLKALRLRNCKNFKDLAQIKDLVTLEVLDLLDCGEIYSLKPIEDMKRLEELWITGDTDIVDGDFSVVDKLPLLHHMFFAQRRHYSCTNEDFPRFRNLERVESASARFWLSLKLRQPEGT